MAYAIICDARRGGNRGINILALVDRAKSRTQWWTSDSTHLMLKYLSLDAAKFACGRLRLNNPRVVDFTEASDEIQCQSNHLVELECLESMEQGWDAHKDVGP